MAGIQLPFGPLGTFSATHIDLGPLERRAQLRAQMQVEANRMLANRNALARAGLRGVIDPETGMLRRDPYHKIEGEGGGGGIMDADAEAKRHALTAPSRKPPQEQTYHQGLEERREESDFQRSLRGMSDLGRKMAIDLRENEKYERDFARSPKGQEAARVKKEQDTEAAQHIGRQTAATTWATNRLKELTDSGVDVATAVQTMRNEAEAAPDAFEKAARMDAIGGAAAEAQGFAKESDFQRKQQQVENLTALQNRIRATMPDAVANIRAENPAATAEDVRARLLTEAQSPDLGPAEKEVLLDEIDQWYDTEAKLEQQRATRQERADVRVEKAERQKEQDDFNREVKKQQAEARAATLWKSDPYVVRLGKQQEALAREQVTMQTKARSAENMMARATNDSVRATAAQQLALYRGRLNEIQQEMDNNLKELEFTRREYDVKVAREMEAAPSTPEVPPFKPKPLE